MSRLAYIGISFAVSFCCAPAHAGSTANKCTDGKEITYANVPCEDLGLKTVGPVKKMITVVPALQETEKKPLADSGNKSGNKKGGSETEVSESQQAGPIKSLVEKIMQ